MTGPRVVRVVNRFPSSGSYPLEDALRVHGVRVERLELSHLWLDGTGRPASREGAITPGPPTLWRLSENVWAAGSHLAAALDADAHLVNPSGALAICADKWSTYLTLRAAAVPAVATEMPMPGGLVPDLDGHSDAGLGTVVKPALGAAGVGVHLRTEGELAPPDAVVPWLAQPYAGDPHEHLRVLVADGQVLASYTRTPAPHEVLVNNIEAGGHRELRTADPEAARVALAAAAAVGARYAGVDLVPDPWRVLEVNGSPGVPPQALEGFAAWVASLTDSP